jgi:hypothetical protein
MFQAKVVEKIKTHVLCSKIFRSEIMPFMGYVDKCGRPRQATDDNITWCRKDMIYMMDN